MRKPDSSPREELTILVVEDEVLNAMLLETYLEEAGYGEIVVATNVEEALAILEQQVIDFALLDINLNGQSSFPVARRLRDLGVPFGFQSAYGKNGLTETFRNCPVIEKPYRQEILVSLAGHLEEMAGT
jgi:CheY-like chemotaxis protein